MEFYSLDTISILFSYEFYYSLDYICIICDAYSTDNDWTILVLEKIFEVFYESLHLRPYHFCGNIIRAFLRLASYALIT